MHNKISSSPFLDKSYFEHSLPILPVSVQDWHQHNESHVLRYTPGSSSREIPPGSSYMLFLRILDNDKANEVEVFDQSFSRIASDNIATFKSNL
jgi:hypothetical protein